MSTPKKLRAGSESELTKFKSLWRDTMSEQARDYWRSLFLSADKTQVEIRKEIAVKLKIRLDHDSQLNAFRAWDDRQCKLDQEAEEMAEDERRFREANPGISEDQLRQKVLLAYYSRALTRGETGLGKAMMRQDLAERRFAFEREQAIETKKTEQQKALEYCLDEAKQYPEVQGLFKDAFAALKKAKSSR